MEKRNMRISFDDYVMEMTLTAAKRSTCMRRAVGAIAVDSHNHIIGTGFNGTPSNTKHCNEDSQCFDGPVKSGDKLDKCKSIHAEQNLLAHVSNPMSIYKVYLTVSPCISCLKLLSATNVREIIYKEEYANIEESLIYAKYAGIKMRKL